MQNSHLEQLRALQKLIEETTPQNYTAGIESLPHSSMGGHVRHILEFFDCFLEGLSRGEIDYTRRKRNLTVEENPKQASSKCEEIIAALGRMSDEQVDQKIYVWSEMKSESTKLSSSVARELEYLFHHMVHHLALIGVYLRTQGIVLDTEFGVAPSTVKYWEATHSTCAP